MPDFYASTSDSIVEGMTAAVGTVIDTVLAPEFISVWVAIVVLSLLWGYFTGFFNSILHRGPHA